MNLLLIMTQTIHILDYISDPERRRCILIQLNRQEYRYALARRVFHGNRGEIASGYKEGQEETVGALGHMLNVIAYWNELYIQAIVDAWEAEGNPIDPEFRTRVSPLTNTGTSISSADIRSNAPKPSLAETKDFLAKYNSNRTFATPYDSTLFRLQVRSLSRTICSSMDGSVWNSPSLAQSQLTLSIGFCTVPDAAHVS